MIDAVSASKPLRLAVIGFGERACHMAKLFCQADPQVRITAIVDPRGLQVIESAVRAEIPDARDIRILDDLDTLVDQCDQFDGIVIGTPCNLHAEPAVRIAHTGLPVFLEKPVAITWSQHASLVSAFAGREESVVVSFPLRMTLHVQKAAEILRSGRLGTINQVQAVNNVPYGGVYFGQWYRDYSKAGGLWLQKATHDFDYINCLIEAASPGAHPTTITAMHSRTVYGGSLPGDLRCSSCTRTQTCPESPQNLTIRGSDGGILNYAVPTPDSDHACAFSETIRNQDAGSAIIMYSDGTHAAYSQNFLTRASAGHRGVTLTGYHATLRFDWQSDQITVIDHFNGNVEQTRIEAIGNHGGGDASLAANFIDLLRGRDESRSSLDQGLLSAAMCLGARDAADTGSAQQIDGSKYRKNATPRGPIEPPPANLVPVTRRSLAAT